MINCTFALNSIHVFDVTLGGGAGLVMGVPPQIRNLHLDFTFQSLEVKFENLLGGGSLEALIETVINELGRSIYRRCFKFEDQFVTSIFIGGNNKAKEVVDAVWAIINEPFCKLIEDAINEALANNMGGGGLALKAASTYVRKKISRPIGIL